VYVDPSGYQGECPGCIPEPPSHPPTPPEPKETPDADTIRRQYEEKIDNDHRNLTYWLINAMETNAHSLEVNEIRLHNQRGSLSVLKAFLVQKDLKCLPRVAMEKILAYSKWYSLVDGGARWDFKNRIYNELGEDIRLCGLFGCNWYKWDVPANIHYGYVGKAAGFKDIELHCGAGYAQKVGIASEEGRLWACFDAPKDFAAIRMGIDLYQFTGSDISPFSFKLVMSSHSNFLRKGQRPKRPYYQYKFDVNSNLGPEFPVSYFDGGAE
jgi:hypothetical protein